MEGMSRRYRDCAFDFSRVNELNRIGSNFLFLEAIRIESDRITFHEKLIESNRIGLGFQTGGSDRIGSN